MLPYRWLESVYPLIIVHKQMIKRENIIAGNRDVSRGISSFIAPRPPPLHLSHLLYKDFPSLVNSVLESLHQHRLADLFKVTNKLDIYLYQEKLFFKHLLCIKFWVYIVILLFVLTLSDHQGKLSDLIKVVFNKKMKYSILCVKSLPLHPSFCEDCFGKLSYFPTMNFDNKITKRKIFSEHPLLFILQFLLLTVVCYSLRRVKYHNWLSKFCVGI